MLSNLNCHSNSIKQRACVYTQSLDEDERARLYALLDEAYAMIHETQNVNKDLFAVIEWWRELSSYYRGRYLDLIS